MSDSGGDGSRRCGQCTVCCTAMRVRALDKPAGQPCEHQTGSGCGIYGRRPRVCAEWDCMWIRDDGRVFDDRHRPDRLGVFFDVDPTATGAEPYTVRAHETRPGAAAGAEAQRVIHFLGQFAPVQVIPCRTRPEVTPLTHNGAPIESAA